LWDCQLSLDETTLAGSGRTWLAGWHVGARRAGSRGQDQLSVLSYSQPILPPLMLDYELGPAAEQHFASDARGGPAR
jgi:hypothetical protein